MYCQIVWERIQSSRGVPPPSQMGLGPNSLLLFDKIVMPNLPIVQSLSKFALCFKMETSMGRARIASSCISLMNLIKDADTLSVGLIAVVGLHGAVGIFFGANLNLFHKGQQNLSAQFRDLCALLGQGKKRR